MACPHVAGAAALLREQEPGATVKQLTSTFNAHGTYGVISDLQPYTVDMLLHVYKKFEV